MTIEHLIQIFKTSLFELGGQPVSLLWIVQLFSALLVVSIFARFIKSFLKHQLLVKLGIDGGNREAIATLTSFCLGAFGYLLVLQATGVNLSSTHPPTPSQEGESKRGENNKLLRSGLSNLT